MQTLAPNDLASARWQCLYQKYFWLLMFVQCDKAETRQPSSYMSMVWIKMLGQLAVITFSGARLLTWLRDSRCLISWQFCAPQKTSLTCHVGSVPSNIALTSLRTTYSIYHFTEASTFPVFTLRKWLTGWQAAVNSTSACLNGASVHLEPATHPHAIWQSN